VLVAPTLLLVASLGGYWISRRALAPVDAIATQARVIGELSLSTRLPNLGTDDELQRLSETLNEMLERIESSFGRVTRFTADASHELRTPVSLIRIESELALRKDRGPEEYRIALQNILIQSEKTGELLENLLALTRADAGRETLVFLDLDLCASVHAVGLWWQNAAKAKSIRLALEVPNEEIWILGDRRSLERLLAILLDNAVKYTPVGGDIIVSLRGGRETAELKVSDTGIGIAPEHQPRVFERFYRVDDSRNKNTGGSGLGLAIAEWIVKQHRGSIVVESKLGHGSTFTVTLPIASSILDAARPSERLSLGVTGAAQADAPSDPTRSGFL
jgi:signal transduction histidine kinase